MLKIYLNNLLNQVIKNKLKPLKAVLSSLKIDRHVNKVEVEQLGTSIMSMEFFDRLKNHNLEPPILRPNGAICGCNPG